jgi:hypothetical protein
MGTGTCPPTCFKVVGQVPLPDISSRVDRQVPLLVLPLFQVNEQVPLLVHALIQKWAVGTAHHLNSVARSGHRDVPAHQGVGSLRPFLPHRTLHLVHHVKIDRRPMADAATEHEHVPNGMMIRQLLP